MFLTYDEAKGYSESELKAMGLFPAGNGNWMDADTAIGLGYPATAFGTGGILQMQGYDVNALNRIISAQNTANFNRDYSPGGAFYNDRSVVSSPEQATEIQKTDSEGGLWNWIVDKATGIGNWIKENPATAIGAGVGGVVGGLPGAGLLASAGAKYDNRNDETTQNVDTATGITASPELISQWMDLPNYTDFTMGDTGTASGNVFDVTPAPTIDYNSLNTSGGILGGVPFNVNQSNNIANPAPNSNINIGETGTPSGQVFDPVINADYGLDTSKMDFMNGTSTITPSYGDNFKNAGLDTNIVNLNDKVNAGPQVTAETGLTTKSTKTTPDLSLKNTTSTPAQIDTSVISNALKNSPLNQNQNTGDVFKNEITNQDPNTGTTDIGGTNTTTFLPTKTYNELTMTPYNISSGLPEGYAPAADRSVSTSNASVSPGSLPQFRKELNRALIDANNAAIMTGRPMSRSTLSGAVEGLAAGASGRMDAANQLALQNRQIESSEKQFNQQMAENQRQFDNGEINKFEYQKREQELQKWKAENEFALDNQKLQLLQDQAATAKDQWERGFITEKEYNDRVLALQEKYAELGYKADADFLKKSEKNQDWGNIIGTLSLLDDLWG
jgi:hypothetical protein